jgi:hypothetical protein
MQRIGNAGWLSACVLATLFVTIATVSAQPANFPPRLDGNSQFDMLAGEPPALPSELANSAATRGFSDAPPALPQSPEFGQQSGGASPMTSPQFGWQQPQTQSNGCSGGACSMNGGQVRFGHGGCGRGGQRGAHGMSAPFNASGGFAPQYGHAMHAPQQRTTFAAPLGGGGCQGGACPMHGQHSYAPHY